MSGTSTAPSSATNWPPPGPAPDDAEGDSQDLHGRPGTAAEDHAAAATLYWLLRFLATGPDADSVARALAVGFLHHGHPHAVALILVDRKQGTMSLAGQFGVPADLGALYNSVPLSTRAPVTEAFRMGVPMWIPVDGMADVFPFSAPVEAVFGKQGLSLGVFPLLHAGAQIGVLWGVFESPITGSWSRAALATAVLDAIALWAVAGTLHPDAPSAGGNGAGATQADRSMFTERQITVLRLLASGKTARQVATAIGFSHSTVKQEIAAMSFRFAATSRRDLVSKAKLAGLLEPEIPAP